MRLNVRTRMGVALFSRCGFSFGREAKVVEVDAKQAKRLREESRLEVIDLPKPEAPIAKGPSSSAIKVPGQPGDSDDSSDDQESKPEAKKKPKGKAKK